MLLKIFVAFYGEHEGKMESRLFFSFSKKADNPVVITISSTQRDSNMRNKLFKVSNTLVFLVRSWDISEKK